MGIRLIDPSKSLSWEYDGSIFEYKEMPADVEARMRKDAIDVKLHQRGTQDIKVKKDMDLEVLKWGVVGWSNVQGGDGKDIPFRKDLLYNLPGFIREDLVKRILRRDDMLSDEEEKKTETVSPSSGGNEEGEDT